MTDIKTPNNQSYTNAARAYGIRQEANMSGFEVTAKLYEGMIRFVGQAKQSYEKGRLDDMCTYIGKTNKILMALQSNLNFEEGGQASVYLNDLYMEIFKRLFMVLRTENPAAEFDAVHNLLKPVAQMWQAHAENAKKANPDKEIMAPTVPDNSNLK